MQQLVNQLRSNFNQGKTKSLDWRVSQLKALYQLLQAHESDICEALFADLKKNPRESYCFEMVSVKNDIVLFLNQLHSFMKPEKVVSCSYILKIMN